MKLLSVSHGKLEVSPKSDRLWVLDTPCTVAMHTDEGTLRATALKGFVTDFRSPHGVIGDIVDVFVPGIGTVATACCYLFHDMCYTFCTDGEHCVSREIADQMLRDGLLLAGMDPFTATAVYDAVRLAGGSPWDEPVEFGNDSKYTFHWDAR